MRKFYTAEAVTEGHPDKLCDQIADAILDVCLKNDENSRVACEVLATKGNIIVAGEITSAYEPDVFAVVRKVLSDIGYSSEGIAMDTFVHQQSPDIAEAVDTYEGWIRKEKLLALQRFYQFCVKHQVADIETMTLAKEQRFEQELSEEFRGKKRSNMFGILRISRKVLFLQAPEIHWQANVWFLERFHFSKERMNPSKPVEWVSFKEVTNLKNQKILQKYLRYLFGITDLSISTIRIKLLELRTSGDYPNI